MNKNKSISVKNIKLAYKINRTFSLKKMFKNKKELKDTNVRKNALDNVSFDIYKGEIIGVIGKNGSGKSTLLKLLTGVFRQDSGKIDLHGNSVSLAAIGVGFIGKLSGRENIILSGTLLGFSKQEMLEKEKEIIEFSGLGDYIDNPVRTYSSGMYSKLAFSITAMLNTDIVLIDEVLSVGDQEFSEKSLNKMLSIIKDKTKTVVFVSHNNNTIRKLCNRVLWLDEGKVKMFDEANKVVDEYISKMKKSIKESKNQWYRKNIINIGGFNFFLDFYNFSQTTFFNSMDKLYKINIDKDGKRIVVMEVNDYFENFFNYVNKEIKERLNKNEIDAIYFYDPDMKYTYDESILKNKESIKYFYKKELLIREIRKNTNTKDIVLYKSCHYIEKMSQIVDEIYGTKVLYDFAEYKLNIKREGLIEYREFGSILEINKYYNAPSNIVLPETFEQKNINHIRGYAFEQSQNLESIVMSNKILSIGICSFYMCKMLKEIKFSNNLKIIKKSAFSNCTSLEKIEIPYGTIHLGYRAFYKCENLKKITVPETVGFIGNEAFDNCPQLIVYGKKGSYVDKYCLENDIKFIEI